MEIQVRGNGVRINDGLREFIDRRATRLDRMVDRVVDAKLELRALHNRVGPDTTAAQITIRSGREVLRAEERATDQMVAIDQAFDKLERQIRRVHDKRSRRHAPGQETIRGGVSEPESISAIDEVELDDERDFGGFRIGATSEDIDRQSLLREVTGELPDVDIHAPRVGAA